MGTTMGPRVTEAALIGTAMRECALLAHSCFASARGHPPAPPKNGPFRLGGVGQGGALWAEIGLFWAEFWGNGRCHSVFGDNVKRGEGVRRSEQEKRLNDT